MSNDVIRLGVLGTASICEKVLPAMQRCNSIQLAAIASRSLSKAQNAAAAYGIPQAFGSYDALLNPELLDALYIPLPNSLHFPWTMKALQAGLHVLCEKPLALSAANAKTMFETSGAAGKHLQEAFMYRHHPQYEVVQKAVRDGAIGELRWLNASFCFMLDDEESIVANPELGGGALWDVGCYPVNLASWLAASIPVSISAAANIRSVDRTLAGTIAFQNGFVASISCSINSAEHHYAEIHGTTGSILLANPWVAGLGANSPVTIRRHGQPDTLLQVQGHDPYFLQACHFAKACQTPALRNAQAEESIRTAAILEEMSTYPR